MVLRLMYEPQELVDTSNLSNEEWLSYRRRGIGGSDAAAILGISPRRTARDLYYDKLSVVKADMDENWVALEMGHLLEDLVARIFAKKTGLRIFQRKVMFQHPLYPWMLADLDYLVELPNGSNAILEIKTTNYNARENWWYNGEEIVPVYYESQGRHYMSVMNLDRVYFCCLYGNNEDEVIIRHLDRDYAHWVRTGGSGGSGGSTKKDPEKKDTAAERKFVDVPKGGYFEDAVDWAVENGITTGTDASHFSPDDVCTRAQAVTFLWRAAGCPQPKNRTMPFTDVPKSSYFYDAVLWAVEAGITKGTSDTKFSPDDLCTRAQIAVVLWRSEGSPLAEGRNPFADVAANAYYADAVLWAVAEDITMGTSRTTFSSDDTCTRAQIVTFLWRCKK